MSERNPPGGKATARSAPGTGSVTDQKLLAAQLFNETWRLIEQEGRSRQDDDRMIHTAHASRYHWSQVPAATPAHLARGEWQISRVYTVLGRAEPALHHARRVLDLCQENGVGDWDLAFAYEALARAHAIAGGRRPGQGVHRPGVGRCRGHRRRRGARAGACRPGIHSRPGALLVTTRRKTGWRS